jgi:hypothetical protein
MFRVVPPPIIRSAYNCTYSIWYLSDRYCYLPNTAKRMRLETCKLPHRVIRSNVGSCLEVYQRIFNVYGSLHRKNILMYVQQDATLHSLFYCSTCFGRYYHPSSGAQITVSTASGICYTVTTTCR